MENPKTEYIIGHMMGTLDQPFQNTNGYTCTLELECTGYITNATRTMISAKCVLKPCSVVSTDNVEVNVDISP